MKHDPYPHRYKRFTEITGEKHLGYQGELPGGIYRMRENAR